jgi:hypothetical protein
MKKLMTICLVVLFVASIVNADVTEYFNRTDWEAAAVAAYLIETFDDATLNPEISFDSGFWNVDLWEDQVSISNPSSEATWSFAPQIYAFGADWDLSYNGDGSGIQVSIGGDAIQTLQYFDGFWGVVSTEAFSTVLLEATGSGPGVETFRLDNMVYTTDKPAIIVDIDIKPGSCPNAFNGKAKGFTPVAIVGSADFDVADVDPTTITLAGISPVKWSYDDSTQPVEDPDCETCFNADDWLTDTDDDGIPDTYLGDGYLDLVLQFDTKELDAEVDGGVLTRDDCAELVLTGEKLNGVPIEGGDFIIIGTKNK